MKKLSLLVVMLFVLTSCMGNDKVETKNNTGALNVEVSDETTKVESNMPSENMEKTEKVEASGNETDTVLSIDGDTMKAVTDEGTVTINGDSMTVETDKVNLNVE